MSKRITLTLFIVLVLTLSACTRAASTPLPTPTLPANFPAAVSTVDMGVIEQAGTQTAIAQTGTPQGGQTQTDATVAAPTTTTDATAVPVVVAPSATPGAIATALPAPTTVSSSAGTKPGSYELHTGEFPYCIARRFNIDPDELLALNGLSKAQDYYTAGTVLKIPQTGKAFPGARALKTHPVSYTVLSGDTIYSIACKFGDVDPLSIANQNGLASPYTLTVGSSITIP